MKKTLEILKNPMLLATDKPTNFLDEILDKETHFRCDKKYRKSFRQERDELRKTSIILNIQLALFIGFCLLMIYLALKY